MGSKHKKRKLAERSKDMPFTLWGILLQKGLTGKFYFNNNIFCIVVLS